MGMRIYTTFFDNVTISAIQDVFSLKASASAGIELHYIELNAGGGIVTPAEIRMLLKRFPVTVTQGTGGTVPTIGFVDSGDTKAAGAVAHANDTTTQMSTSGTAITLAAWQWNVLLPFQYLTPPEDREVCSVSEGFALNMPAAPASTVVSGFIKWHEFP
jgi:hypothetical protein